jgi:hypothetical protein
LKTYGGRLHSKKLQDLPIHPDIVLTHEQMIEIDHYCTNDLITTYDAYLECKPQIDLRIKMSEVYGTDLRSKSDAQIAEAIIKAQLGFVPERPVWHNMTSFKYVAPTFISFHDNKYMQDILDLVQAATFYTSDKEQGGETTGVIIPDEIKNLIVTIGTTNYKMGIGGLHSMEESVHYIANSTFSICDADVTSYYPSLILICGMYPKQLGERFISIYKEIYDDRLIAKKEGRKVESECGKIILNGFYGKLGSKYSILYAPDLMLQVTLTGQLSILMLICMLEKAGIKVMSANTDGVVMLCPASYEFMRDQIISYWETRTGLGMEYTNYKAIYNRDVNSYVAIKPDGSHKCKGLFAEPAVDKNPQNHISIVAAIEYLKNGTPLYDTIISCKDIREFLIVRNVKGGAVHVGYSPLPIHETKEQLISVAGFMQVPMIHPKVRYFKGTEAKEYTLGAAYKLACEQLQKGYTTPVLGKVVRYYYTVGELGNLAYATNGNKVPMSEGARPLMELPETLPNDINYDKYVKIAKDILTSVSITVD